jgi:hypothetical protein
MNYDITDLIEFAKEYARLGHSIQSQLDELLDTFENADLNGNAVVEMKKLVAPLARIDEAVAEELSETITSWIDSNLRGENNDD